LYALPAVAVAELGFIQNLEKNQIRVPRRIVSCERPPEIGELLDKLVVVRQFLLEVRIRVDVDDYCEPLIQNHLDRGIQISQVVLGNSVCLFAAEHWQTELDRKSTRLNSSHVSISYAVFCLKKKKNKKQNVEII